ncbi:unnamed protein product [Boreogadus saida]
MDLLVFCNYLKVASAPAKTGSQRPAADQRDALPLPDEGRGAGAPRVGGTPLQCTRTLKSLAPSSFLAEGEGYTYTAGAKSTAVGRKERRK